MNPAARQPDSSGRRQTSAWTDDLYALRKALSSGTIYDRELADLAAPLEGVLNAYVRRTQHR